MQQTYKIGEAATLLNLKTYVLRFWETEFPQIAPLRTDKGQRLYTQEHIALLAYIRYLLHEKGLTIEGARKELLRGLPDPLPFPLLPPRQPSLLDESPEAYGTPGIAPSTIQQQEVSALLPPATGAYPGVQPAMQPGLQPSTPPVHPGTFPVTQPAMQPVPLHHTHTAHTPMHQPDALNSDALLHLLDELEAVADLLRS